MLSRVRFPLWLKLAAFAVLGVIATHAVHLVVAVQIADRAVVDGLEVNGASMARLVAQQASDAVLIDDVMELHDLVTNSVGGSVAYCFITRDGRVLASSTLPAVGLVGLRTAGDHAPMLVDIGGHEYIDVAAPIMDGGPGIVRVGMDTASARATGRKLAGLLVALAATVMVAGIVAAFVVGRGIARPLGELLRAAARFDPNEAVVSLPLHGRDEIADVTRRFNEMMVRLKAAHDEQMSARSRQVATERMAALGFLVPGIAHEVNNPLGGIKNCVRLMQKGDIADDERREYLALMAEGIGRIEQTLQHLLKFSRPRPLLLAPVSAQEIVHEAGGLVGPMLHNRHIGYDVALGEEGDSRVVADRNQMSQALLNLILNAAYVTPEGKAVRVRLRWRPGFIGFSVEDQGPGIPREIRDRVTTPFFTTKPEGEGTGLGLSVTQSIVDAHDGELTLECPEGGGTVATIWLRES